MTDVIIVGTGGHAKVVADIVLCGGDKVVGFLTKRGEGDTFLDRPVLGRDTDYEKYRECHFILAIGNQDDRERVANLYKGVKWYTAVHPSAVVSALDTGLGEGSVVMANAVINPGAKIGRHCIVNSGAIVEHDNVVEEFAHISVGAKLAGDVRVGRRTWVGVGAIVKNGVSICENCMIGAGAVVVKNVEEPGTYVGIPAQKIGQLSCQ